MPSRMIPTFRRKPKPSWTRSSSQRSSGQAAAAASVSRCTRWPEHGAQAAGNARLVVGEVALERGPPDTLLRNPQVLQHFAHGERVIFRPPSEVFGADHRRHLPRPFADSLFLLEEKIHHVHAGIIRFSGGRKRGRRILDSLSGAA